MHIDHEVYYILVRTCKMLSTCLNIRSMKDHFTRGYVTLNNPGSPIEGYAIRYMLPNGVVHRGNDLPAVIYTTTHAIVSKYWYIDGYIHREVDLPAGINRGRCEYYNHGAIHRGNDLPAVIERNSVVYYKHGLIHRDGDLPAIINDHYSAWIKNSMYYTRENDQPNHIESDGHKSWRIGCVDSKNTQMSTVMYHRDNDLPARITADGTRMWYRYGYRHRDNGLPAVIYPDNTCKYYIHGRLGSPQRDIKKGLPDSRALCDKIEKMNDISIMDTILTIQKNNLT